MPSFQVTLGAGATTINVHGIGYRQLIIQNNAAGNVRAADRSTPPTASAGLLITPGNNANWGPANVQLGVLSDKQLFGTAGQIIDVDYVPA